MSDMQPGEARVRRPASVPQKFLGSVPLPMLSLDFDGINTITVTLEGVTGTPTVYGTPSEMVPTQQLTQQPDGTWTGTYTPGVDTIYTIDLQDPTSSVASRVVTVLIPASAGTVTVAAMPRPDIDLIVSNPSSALFCADSVDGQVYSDPAEDGVGLVTTVQPAACDFDGVLTVAAIVDGAIQMRQQLASTWRVVDLGGDLPTSGVQSIALAEFGGKAFLAAVHGTTLGVYRNTLGLESDWVAVGTFPLTQPFAGLGLGSDGRALMLGWNDGGTLETVVTTNADQPNWTTPVSVLTPTLFGVGPAIASVGATFVLASVTSGLAPQVALSSDNGATWQGPYSPSSQSTTFVSLTRHFGELSLAIVASGSPQVGMSVDGVTWGSFTAITSRGAPWQGSGAPAIAGGPPVQSA